MFFSFLVFSLSKESSLSKIKIGEKRNVTNDSPNQSFFISPLTKTVFKTSNNEKYYLERGQIIELSKNDTVLSTESETEVYLWKIPKGICKNSKTVLVDYSSELIIDGNLTEENVCLFFQPDTVHTNIKGELESNEKKCKMEVYTEKSIEGGNKPELTTNKIKEKYSTPFFIRISDCEGSKVNAHLKISMMRSKISAFDCNVYPIPKISDDYIGKNSVKMTKCLAASDEFITYLKYMFLALLIIGVLLFIIELVYKRISINKGRDHVE